MTRERRTRRSEKRKSHNGKLGEGEGEHLETGGKEMKTSKKLRTRRGERSGGEGE